jgi:hypothetical protein
MNVHEILKIIGGALALLLFIPMARQTLKENGAGQSFATWILWAALDSILAASTIIRHGNFFLPLGFAIGGVAMTILLLAKHRYAWTKLDSAILILVVICVVAWKFGGARTAIVASTLATSIATIPGLVELWRNPNRTVANLWGIYTLANFIAFVGGTAMTIEERFAPAIFTILSLAMFIVGRRKSNSAG